MESCLNKLSFCLKTAIFGGGNMVVLPLQDPKVCQAWLIWALNPTYKCPLRN